MKDIELLQLCAAAAKRNPLTGVVIGFDHAKMKEAIELVDLFLNPTPPCTDATKPDIPLRKPVRCAMRDSSADVVIAETGQIISAPIGATSVTLIT